MQDTSETVKQKGDVIAYEDSQCRIDYNLWTEHGDAGFSFYNKTDEVIHLMLDESFYVLNNVAHDYYQNRIFSDGNNSTVTLRSGIGFGSYSAFGMISTFSKSITSNSMNSVSVIEPKTISIPPKTSKRISEFDISQNVYRDCDLLRYPSPRKVTVKSFGKENSPLQFYNTISYTVGGNESRMTVKNDFYVSEITNLPEKEMFKSIRKEFCGEKDYSPMQVFKDSPADKFYIKYIKTQSWKH